MDYIGNDIVRVDSSPTKDGVVRRRGIYNYEENVYLDDILPSPRTTGI